MNVFLAIIVFIILLVVVEMAKKIFSFSGEISRKIAHVTSAAIIFFLPYYLSQWQIVFLAAFFVIILIFSKRLNLLTSIHQVARKTWGEILLPAGTGVAALLFLPNHLAAFQFGILVMGISDGLGGIIGLRFGRNKIILLKNGKPLFQKRSVWI